MILLHLEGIKSRCFSGRSMLKYPLPGSTTSAIIKCFVSASESAVFGSSKHSELDKWTQ